MFTIYSKTTGEVFQSKLFVDTAVMAEDGVLRGYFDETKERWAGYHPSTNPGVYELTNAQVEAWDESKLYTFNEETKEFTERQRPLSPEEEQARQLEGIEAQVAYTAMMTDTLIEG